MKPDEEFAAEALVAFLGGPRYALVHEVEKDPPDFILDYQGATIGVEVTQLRTFVLDEEGKLSNRTTQDEFGLRLIEKIEATVGNAIPYDRSILLTLRLPIPSPKKFERELTEWLTSNAGTLDVGSSREVTIQAHRVGIFCHSPKPAGPRLSGMITAENAIPNIRDSVRVMLSDRVREKAEKCAELSRPVWLLLINAYPLADGSDVAAIAKEMALTHPFERILVVSSKGNVTAIEFSESRNGG